MANYGHTYIYTYGGRCHGIIYHVFCTYYYTYNLYFMVHPQNQHIVLAGLAFPLFSVFRHLPDHLRASSSRCDFNKAAISLRSSLRRGLPSKTSKTFTWPRHVAIVMGLPPNFLDFPLSAPAFTKYLTLEVSGFSTKMAVARKLQYTLED